MSDESVTPAAAVPVSAPLGKYEDRLRAETAARVEREIAAENERLNAEVERLRSLHAAPEGARLRALTKIGAEHRHWNVGNDHIVYGHEHDRVAPHECSHPDCLLVRPAPAPVVAEGALRALVESLVEAIFERGRKASSGEPLFFDRLNLRLVIEAQLAALLPARPASVKET